jgi:hypothetical protein
MPAFNHYRCKERAVLRRKITSENYFQELALKMQKNGPSGPFWLQASKKPNKVSVRIRRPGWAFELEHLFNLFEKVVMKSKIVSTFLGASILGLFLTGCGEPEQFVLKADEGQMGSDATITMTGNTGRIRVSPLPNLPEGLDQKVTEVERINSPTYSSWKVETEHKLTISFLVVAGAYVCESCALLNLPLTWHPVKKPK